MVVVVVVAVDGLVHEQSRADEDDSGCERNLKRGEEHGAIRPRPDTGRNRERAAKRRMVSWQREGKKPAVKLKLTGRLLRLNSTVPNKESVKFMNLASLRTTKIKVSRPSLVRGFIPT